MPELGITIKIHFESSHNATMEINGRRLELVGKMAHGGGSIWTMVGLDSGDCDFTLGGMIARKLHSPLTDILQAWMPDSMPDRPPECWERLTEEVAEEIEDEMCP